MKKSIKCAVVGVGYLGKFHADKYAVLPNAELVAVCDSDEERSKEIATKYNISALSDYRDLVGKVDAVSIAAITSAHYEIAKFFLENKIHVLIEKPITTSVETAEELQKIAKKNKLVIQVGQLERFNPAFTALKKHLNKPIFIEAVRLAPFKLRCTDVSVILDSMIHDIDLILNIIAAPIENIYAYGAPVLSDKIDMATANIEFANGCIANIKASRVSMQTKRKIQVFQSDSCLTCDLNDKSITVYGKGQSKIKPYMPEITSEKISLETNDALYTEIEAFVNSIIKNTPPPVTAVEATKALQVALEIEEIATKHLLKLEAN
ncbi:MAG: UDP-N-acetyl-D-glucosamine dehydrogenase [Gammaproteobacteria bacterium GWE2_37_16]|nr:MAG: UDP-N-acetyl-D-glucosamine dehydrogenase [Gammaproteobacteria bacterium GWE2_37_16]